ncbi:intramolecular transferase [Coccomyxa subellipsoidea C-169]|uniref:Phosphoacetylglucosamine mutase n=1 Tax=Coccomyxa subellipsoidea (strain C-169) TaxID=574566 RepID=I0YJY8_COCSC|nr:intramolecular transferase [Coccomyxa subellipsoidea C-169]EIE18707.1 intramolecular transferase [Coccomyxa subellipsoidea C-169]|eukprot:XP_005643251.1 intramolecular transferase [Coccomyxa subellipsoidea C-169]
MDLGTLKESCSQYNNPSKVKLTYGTAGFRAEASLLPSTVYRCGLLMALRALKTGGVTGLVVTASHNPVEDNGVKLVDPTGYMLDQAWEAWANKLAAADDEDGTCAVVQELFQVEDIPYGSSTVMLAHDTRPSADALVKAAAAGVAAMGSLPIACGQLTTPQLHWMVRQCNAGLKHKEKAYYEALATGYARLVSGHPAPSEGLIVDCANGVGAAKLQVLADRLAPGLSAELRNTGAEGLNDCCGADFLQKERRLPAGFQDVPEGARCASLDGDADRLVYFQRRGAADEVHLFDGDRIAVLAALLVMDLLRSLITAEQPPPTVGIVQTAYANGASTAYIEEKLKCEVRVTPTGVKHLHAAAEEFDVGIYFEANGHGTVLFSAALVQRLHELGDDSGPAKALLALVDMVNQAVGDALSGVLLVEAALRRKKWGLPEWAALYTDLPSRQLKVKVADRSVVTTSHAETRVESPSGLQQLIDSAVAAAPSGRAFVRPSGTEDVVRVYAEAATQSAADDLARLVARHVHSIAAGVGLSP